MIYPCGGATALQRVMQERPTSASDLQKMVNIRKTTGTDGKGIVYYLPQSLINNSLAAFNTGGFTPARIKAFIACV